MTDGAGQPVQVGADGSLGVLAAGAYHLVVANTAGAGTDEVRTVLATYALGANVENLAFAGTGSPFYGIGNGLANVITGGTGNDQLDGGLGDDLYNVDDAVADSGGDDKVFTNLLSTTLGAGLEDLIFSGAGNFAGTGNALANAIVGGAGIDALSGGAGNDGMDGGGGDDVLYGDGDDFLLDDVGNNVKDGGAGNDRINVGQGNDTLTLSAGADDIYLGLNGPGNAVVVDFEATINSTSGSFEPGSDIIYAPTIRTQNLTLANIDDYIIHETIDGGDGIQIKFDTDGTGTGAAPVDVLRLDDLGAATGTNWTSDVTISSDTLPLLTAAIWNYSHD